MAINVSLSKIMLGLFSLGGTASVYAGPPMWTFAPLTPTTLTIADGASASVQYSVQNQSLKPKRLTMLPIPGVNQTSTCILAPRGQAGSSCMLDLAINGSAISRRGVQGGPALCQTNADGTPNPNQCYRPSAGNELLITKNTATSLFLVTVGEATDGVGGTYLPVAYTSNDNGNNWVPSVTPPSQQGGDTLLEGVRCGTSGHCVARGTSLTGPVTYVSNDQGVNWAVSAASPAVQSDGTVLTGLACDSTGSHCVAMGITSTSSSIVPSSYISNDGGNTWSISATQPPGTGSMGAVDCDALGTHCAALTNGADSQGVFKTYISNDGGNTWLAAAAPPVILSGAQNSSLVDINCNGNKCVAVGGMQTASSEALALAYTSNDGGNTWGPAIALPSPAGLTNDILLSVSCDSAGNHCVAVGGGTTIDNSRIPSSYVSNDGGNTWVLTSPAQILGTSSQFSSVYCDPTGRICAAVGYYSSPAGYLMPASLVSNDGGITWNNSQTMPPPLNVDTQLHSISGATR